MATYYPNACFICNEVKNNLKRCSRCQMVSYCGEDHQKVHWPRHKYFCKVISTIMKENGVSHIFEKLRGLDMESWSEERLSFYEEVEKRLNRPFELVELEMLQFPRSCFVCYDTNQADLKNCPGCPSASFCKEHPTSSLHDRDCSKIKNGHEMGIEMLKFNPKLLIKPQKAIMSATLLINESSKLPNSMREFIDKYCKPGYDISECEKIFMSDMYTTQLTILDALQKLNYPSVSKLIIHAEGPKSDRNWELLLHLLPNLKILQVVYEGAIGIGEKIALCKKCLSRGKKLILKCNKLPYELYMKQKDYEEPNILVIFDNFRLQDDIHRIRWQIKLLRSSELNCPIILTTRTEMWARLLKETLSSTIQHFMTYYGPNEFAALFNLRDYLAGSLCAENYFMMIIKPQNGQCKKHNQSRRETIENISLDLYYSSYCPICCSTKTPVMCNRCKMIFYCGKAHQDKHLPQHKDICKVVLRMLNESGTSNLFDKLKTTDSESWMLAKIDLMKKAKVKLGRELLKYEKQMFLFPKTCFVCHEGDLTLLKNCKCGVILCKMHKDNLKHKQLCPDFSLAYKISMIKEPTDFLGTIKVKPGPNQFYSMETFIDSNFKILETPGKLYIPHFQKIMLSYHLTRPLTLLFALKKLDIKIESPLVIHVIGTSGVETGTHAYWKAVLRCLEHLKKLKVVFIGPKALRASPSLQEKVSYFEVRKLKVECHVLKYEEYFQSKSFLRPNIIMGFNLGLHESDLGISECTWKETILTLKKVGVPFILTAGTKERAQKDHEKFCKLLERTVDFTFCEVNPFAGLSPKRDFETEGILYSNKYIIIYDGKYENSSNSKEEEQKLVEKSSDVEKSERNVELLSLKKELEKMDLN